MISFSCSCGKPMQAKDDFAGRKIKCSKCGKVVPIPKPVADEEEPDFDDVPAALPVATSAKAAPPKFDMDDDEEDAAPVARPVRSSSVEEDEDDEEEEEASPVAMPVAAAATTVSAHPWDTSFNQQPTPWLPGDEERFQKGIKKPYEGLSGAAKFLLVLLVLVGGGAAFWLGTEEARSYANPVPMPEPQFKPTPVKAGAGGMMGGGMFQGMMGGDRKGGGIKKNGQKKTPDRTDKTPSGGL